MSGSEALESELEKRLARSEALLAEAQRLAHVGSWEWDIARNTVTWTDELYRIYGEPEQERAITYETFLERVHPDDRGRTRDVIFAAFRDTNPFEYDHRIVRLDGSVRMLHTRGAVVADSAGKAERLVGCCWDVTEKWQSEKRLEDSLSLLHATLEATGDGIFAVDLEGRIVTVNRRCLELWELPENLAEGRDVWDVVEHVRDKVEDPEGFASRERELLADRESVTLDTIRFKNGQVFERYSQPQRVGSRTVGRVCSFRDVTERERLLRNAVFLSDASRLLESIDMEKALDAVTHLALPLLGSACAVDLFTGTGGPRRIISSSLRDADPTSAELPRTVLTGSSSIYTAGTRSCMAVPLTVRGDVVGALTFIAPPQRRFAHGDLELAEELSRRMALTIENARLYRESQEALHARDEFLDVASHEIRGPVASLHLAVQNLEAARDPATTAKLLGVVERADRRLARFVDELFDVAHIRSGHLRFELEEVDLGAVTRDVLSRFSSDLTRCGSSLSLSTRGSLTGTWDRSRVDQVVSNLLANAIKFGLGNAIEIQLEGGPDTVRLRIADHGVGIPAERLHAILGPFERASVARHYGGLGLGLFITQTIVQGLGGTIAVASKPGEGSTFTIELPKVRKP